MPRNKSFLYFKYIRYILFALFILKSACISVFATSNHSVNSNEKTLILATTKPIYNLTAAVTKQDSLEQYFDLTLLIKGNSSPHDFNLKPSDIKLLNKANVIIWSGKNLEPYLNKIIAARKNKSLIIDITEAKNLTLLPFRNLQMFIDNGHNGHHDRSNHHSLYTPHKHIHSLNYNNNHGSKLHANEKSSNCSCYKNIYFDSHIWLSPTNGLKIATYLSKEISTQYPKHKTNLNKNLTQFKLKLNALERSIKHKLSKILSKQFLVYHDAFQYFEQHYGLSNKAAITLNPGFSLSAKSLLQIENIIKTNKIKCIFHEPQFNPKLTNILCTKLKIKNGVLDPLGDDQDLGKDGYLKLLQDLADNLYVNLK